MGHSTNILGLKVGISFKQKFFFISSGLINYYSDFTFFYRFCFQYLYFLVRFKYYKNQIKHSLLYSHLIFQQINTKLIFKIYVKDYFYEYIVAKFFFLMNSNKKIKNKNLKRKAKLNSFKLKKMLKKRYFMKYQYQFSLMKKFKKFIFQKKHIKIYKKIQQQFGFFFTKIKFIEIRYQTLLTLLLNFNFGKNIKNNKLKNSSFFFKHFLKIILNLKKKKQVKKLKKKKKVIIFLNYIF